MEEDRLLIPGETCWRTAHADRFASIIDGADYFKHVKAAMLRAQHRIMLIGWDFDARTTFERGTKTLPGPNQLGAFLYWLLWKRSDLEVCLLRSNLRLLPAFDGLWDGFTPVALLNQISSRRMRFAIDGARPTGAVHHQKIVVVDDAAAFCGGIDLTVDRWDTPAHEDAGRSRRTVGRSYGPRHEVAAAVDGAAARALGEQARDRWQTATGRSMEPIEARIAGLRAAEQAQAEAQAMLSDPEMKELASAELENLKQQLPELEFALRLALLPKDEMDDDLTLTLELVEPAAVYCGELRLGLDAVVENGVDLRERMHLSQTRRA